LSNAIPVASDAGPSLTAEGRAVPLRLGDEDWWSLMAVSGAHPLDVMGEWDGVRLSPLTAWAAGSPRPLWTQSAA
ncbi:MAG TPA: hypothetical protein VIP05_00470, partial [Burkholderiaceae bacterium]